MLHQQLCKISDKGAIAVFAVGAVVTLVMYISASLIMLLKEDTDSEDSTNCISSRMFSKGALFVMFACAGLGGLIMVYALDWYFKSKVEDETSTLEMVPELEFEDSYSEPAAATAAATPAGAHKAEGAPGTPVQPGVLPDPPVEPATTDANPNLLRIPMSESFN